MAADVVVTCSALVKVFEAERGIVQALRGVDLAARAGTVTAVAGPSGSGKTSLLRLLGAIDKPTAGEVTIGGVEVAALPESQRRLLRRRRIGFVLQRPADNLVAGLSVRHQLEVAARYRGVGAVEVDHLIDTLGLSGRADHYPRELSGGEQQRVALARAALGDPTLVVADEPTAELDLATTRAVADLLKEIAATRGAAVIVATHDPEVMGVADHVLLLRDGAVQSERFEGVERTVIDATGRVQLPPEVLEWYPTRRVVLEFDPETNTIMVRPA